MAHKHRFTTVAGTCGTVVRCGCGKTRTTASGTAFDSGTFKSGRDRRAARTALRKAARK